MTRIRYYDTEIPGSKKSKPILAGVRFVTVTINVDQLNYVVEEFEVPCRVVASGNARDLFELKKTVKKQLTDLGANFTSEARNRDTNEAPEVEKHNPQV